MGIRTLPIISVVNDRKKSFASKTSKSVSQKKIRLEQWQTYKLGRTYQPREIESDSREHRKKGKKRKKEKYVTNERRHTVFFLVQLPVCVYTEHRER